MSLDAANTLTENSRQHRKTRGRVKMIFRFIQNLLP
jgi:hypothetical protein